MSIRNLFSRSCLLALIVCATFNIATQAQTQHKQSSQTKASAQTDPSSPAVQCYGKMRCMTPAMRKAAAVRNAARRAAAGKSKGGDNQPQQQLAGQVPTCPIGTMCYPNGNPDYFGIANYANTKPLQKFINTLAGLGSANANNLGQFIPIATPFSTPPPGVPNDGDYYEIGLRNYSQVFHNDLQTTPTSLRGYYDKNPNAQDGNSNHYLGPLIIAQRDRPVRVKFYNELPTGTPGNLFIPVDPTYMGASTGSNGQTYTQNRAIIHLHGGVTPWISDGQPHQWITPAGETGGLVQGVSQQNVPDMPQPQPGDGTATFYYTNQQGARLMWYHDHSYGITRLNVYAGEASGYLLVDNYEKDMIEGTNLSGINPSGLKAIPDLGGVYHYGMPLIIQDKTFVPPVAQLANEDNTWDLGLWGGEGNLWFPHVYTPNQNPGDESGANAFGRWDWGPWFWPPQDPSTLKLQPYACSSAANPNNISGQWMCPGVPTPVSGTPEAFMDTPLINGTAYPTVTVDPKAYRFRILNAANDRTLNLSMFQADTTIPQGQPGYLTEVKMVPAAPTQGWPPTWPTDGRDGGVPDPATMGPPFIQIGTEGGFLPAPVVIPPQPVAYEYNRRNIVVLNISFHGLLLGPAERADVIVDFSAYAGKTLILYNDAPAPVPAFDTRLDYYTGDPDQTWEGGAPTTQPGYGPNTRTMMQIVVNSNGGASFDSTNLNTLLPKAFVGSQAQPVVPEKAYNADYGTNFPNTYSRIQDTSLTFAPYNGQACKQDSDCTGGTCNTTVGICTATTQMGPKAIQELFTLDYGRMNATLGTELPFTGFNNQTTVPLGFVDPPTENIQGGVTQLWKVTHNGVDTHFIHFHLFNVQVINRVGWDGAIRPPDADELGWKDTVRMNPLEDAIVAVNPIIPIVPFPVPDSVRLLDPTCPENGTNANGCNFTNLDPLTGNPVNTVNVSTNFGWEYIWHCHILGHEENDMMRPMVVEVPLQAPTNLSATWNASDTAINLAFTDTTLTETGFNLQRALDSGFTQSLLTTPLPPNPGWGPVLYSDTGATSGNKYYYRVQAVNGSITSPWSNTASTKIGQTIVFQSIGNQTYGVSPITLVATASSGLPVTFSVISGPANVVGNILTITGVGSVIVQASQAGDLTYAAASLQQTITVAPAVLTLTANSASFTYGGTLPALTYTMTGFVNGETQGTATTGTPSITTTATSTSPAGTYTITAAQGTLTSANYTFTFVNGTLTINKALLTVTANSFTIADGQPFPTFTASYTGFVNGDGVGVLSGSPSLTTTATGNSGPGTYPIVAAQGTLAAANYTFAFVNGTLTITPSVAQITAPPKGSTLLGNVVTFTWTKQSYATLYYLYVGSSPGTYDIAAMSTGNLSTTVSNLPIDGRQVYVTLYANDTGSMKVKDTATYTAISLAKAVITAPTKGSTLSGTTVTFSWTAETGANLYILWVGSSPGTHDIAAVSTGNLSITVSNLPSDSRQVYVTLKGNGGGGMIVQDTATYTAASNIIKAVITAPTKGSTLSGNTVTFSWTAETGGANLYYLYVGSSPGAYDIAAISTGNLSTTVSNLPIDGRQVYVTLKGNGGGGMTVQDTATYTAISLAKAVITAPTKGSTLSGHTVTFSWTAETGGANLYILWVGSSPGTYDIAAMSTGNLSTTVNNLPIDGRQVYVTLKGNGGGGWTVQDIATYTAFH